MIGIINYGMGNLRSVQKAFEFVGAQAVVVDRPEDIPNMDRLILPGVGAFNDAMRHLNDAGFVAPIREFVASGKPFLGICLGMQLLFEGSDERAVEAEASDAESLPGLGLLQGRIRAFAGPAFGAGKLKIPHMGWNTLSLERNDDPLLQGLSSNCSVYFVHGYHASAQTLSRSAMCDYGGPFCATVWKDNLWATQFHPEKSQRVGLTMLKNFATLT